MRTIQQLSERRGRVREWLSFIRGEGAPLHDERPIDGRPRRVSCAAVMACAMISISLPLTAWTAEESPLTPIQPRTVVAAGVGYENAETSMLTVKTYDAESGAILSDDTFELDVRENSGSGDSAPRERVFAGGVGPGADGLSEFTLRAYDAATGTFLWEGLLNLSAANQAAGSSYPVVAHLGAQRARVTQVRTRVAIDTQPQFFLHAVDSATGQLAWTDHFSAGIGTSGHAEPVSSAIVGQTEGLAAPSQQIEFRIRMMDEQGRTILWEDQIKPTRAGDLTTTQDRAAQPLPVWRGEGLETLKRDAI